MKFYLHPVSAAYHDCRALQCVAVCCSVLQCVAMCCSVLQCVAVFCSVLQCVVVCCSMLQYFAVLPATGFRRIPLARTLPARECVCVCVCVEERESACV